MDWKKLSSIQENLGGYGAQIFSYQFLEPYITSDSSNVSTAAHFRYVDHIDNITLKVNIFMLIYQFWLFLNYSQFQRPER